MTTIKLQERVSRLPPAAYAHLTDDLEDIKRFIDCIDDSSHVHVRYERDTLGRYVAYREQDGIPFTLSSMNKTSRAMLASRFYHDIDMHGQQSSRLGPLALPKLSDRTHQAHSLRHGTRGRIDGRHGFLQGR